jgi:flavin reductase
MISMTPREPTLRDQFLEGMSRGATFVSVVTTDGAAGRFGVTVSSLTSVAVDGEAPSLLCCIHQQSAAAAAILVNGRFSANLLSENQQNVADIFSGRRKIEPAERFNTVAWFAGSDGQPLIEGATASFECALGTSMTWETHYILIGRVQTVQLSPVPGALLYGQRAYKRAIALP